MNEIEMTFDIPSFYVEGELEKNISSIGFIDKGKFFENNILFDTENYQLRENGLLFRLRENNNKNIITFKGKIKKNNLYKIREEIECEISDFKKFTQIMINLGYKISLIYQKYRHTFILDNIMLTIDELPFGKYIEIEGTKEAIINIKGKLKLDISDISNMSYYDIYQYDCKKKKIKPNKHIIFKDFNLSEFFEKIGYSE